MPRTVVDIRREHVEAFLIDLQDRGMKPATVSQRFRSLQQFWKWLASDGVIASSPMANMKPPHVPESPPPVLTDAEIDKLIATTAGTDFAERRDRAILMLFMDTGMRRGELSGLRLEDIDFDHMVALVVGKGRRPRACPFGNRTAKALSTVHQAGQEGAPRGHSATGSGWASAAGSPRRASSRSSSAAVPRPGCPACTRTSSATPSPTSGSPPRAARATSCGSPAGRVGRCSAATVPAPPTSGRGPPTGA